MIRDILEFLFRFPECTRCSRKKECDRKPWLHNEDSCQYRKEHHWQKTGDGTENE